MKYCVHCGKEILDEAVVCPHCGCLVKTVEKNKRKEVFQHKDLLELLKKKKGIVISAAIIILLFAISIAVLNNDNIFDKVSYGMSMEEVHSNLGNPDEVDDLFDYEYDIYYDTKFAGINGTLRICYEYGSVQYTSWDVEISDDVDSNRYRQMIEEIKSRLNKISGLGEPSYSEDGYYTWDIVPGRSSYVLDVESDNLSVIDHD